MTHFIFDCDDVLLDWETGFLNWLDPDGTKIDRAGPKSWCLAEWLHCSQMEAAMWVREFNASERFGQLKARPGARELVWDLRDAGHTISVLTACGENRGVQRARVQNLDREFTADPSRLSERLQFANGIRSYCLRRSHNRQQEAENPDTQVIWIDDLDAIRLDL